MVTVNRNPTRTAIGIPIFPKVLGFLFPLSSPTCPGCPETGFKNQLSAARRRSTYSPSTTCPGRPLFLVKKLIISRRRRFLLDDLLLLFMAKLDGLWSMVLYGPARFICFPHLGPKWTLDFYVMEHLLIQAQVRHHALEPAVLLLQLL